MLKGILQNDLFYCNHLGVSENDERDITDSINSAPRISAGRVSNENEKRDALDIISLQRYNYAEEETE